MARSKKINDEMREIRLEQIKSEALIQFSMKGLAATKIKDIAAKLNISQGLIYHYYKSKDEIFIELINYALDKINEEVYSLKDLDVKPHIKMEKIIEKLLSTIKEQEDFNQVCRLLSQATDINIVSDDIQKKIDEKKQVPYNEIKKIIEEGQIEGTIVDGDPSELSITFWVLITGVAVYKASTDCRIKVPNEQIIKKMFIKRI